MSNNKPLEQSTVLIYDTGLSLEHAVKLASKVKRCLYFTPWVEAFPKFESFAPGVGMEGINKVLNYFAHIEEADWFMFPDVGAGDLCAYLKRTTNKPVYGAGKGEILEANREVARQWQRRLGLKTQATKLVTGVSELRKELKKSGHSYVKLDIFRGDIDSFEVKDVDSVGLTLDRIANAFGPFKEKYNFIIEDYIGGLEPGLDLFFNGQRFLQPYLIGFEHAKSCYIGYYTTQLPLVFQKVLNKLTPLLRKLDYRGAISLEFRMPNKNDVYLIDWACRFPFPLSATYTEALENYSDVIYQIARKRPILLKPKAKYVACLPLASHIAEKNWVRLDFPENMRNKIKFRVACNVNGKYYGIKGHEWVYVLITWGNNINQMIEELSRLADMVKAEGGLALDVIGGLNLIKKDIIEIQKMGIPFN